MATNFSPSSDEEKKRTEMFANSGHRKLIADITELLKEAGRGEFHDFLSEKYATPKIALRNKFSLLMSRVVEGKYDN